MLIASHILGELEKTATHYGIIRHGRMIREMTAEEPEADCPTYIALKTRKGSKIKLLLHGRFSRVEEDEDVVSFLYEKGVTVSEIIRAKIGLEEYYISLMNGRKGR